MQGVAGGAHAVAVARRGIDDPAGRRAVRQHAEARAQACRTGGAENRRNAGQRHVVADVQIAADADTGDVLGQAQAVDVDVVGVGELVGGALQRVVQVGNGARAAQHGQPAGVEPGLRQDLRTVAVIDAQGAVQPLRRPLGHHAPVAALVRRRVVAATDGGQRAAYGNQARGAGMAEQEGLCALADQIGTAVVGAGLGQARLVPIEEVLGAQGQLGVDLEGGGNLVARNEQLLGLGARRSRQFGQVQARLAVAQRVHRVEQGLAPEQVVLADLGAEHRLLTHFGLVEHEGVEDFAGGAAVVALRIVAQVRAAQRNAGARQAEQARVDARLVAVAVDERIGIGTGVVVGLVVPAGGADAKAHRLLVDHVQFGQQVDAIGDVGPGLAEVVVAVVVVRRGQHALVGALGAHTVVVLDGVVEAHGPVLTAGIDLEGLGGGHGCQHDGRGQQTEAQWAYTVILVVMHCVISACFYCC
ncbi:hypothetical protein D3C78_933320 [compost metagenome]